jgi:hypothetical protein
MAGNLFLDAQELLQQNDGLNYINYNTLKEEHKEFLLSNLWDFKFIVPPAAVYYPGDQLLSARTISVDPSFPGSLSEITAIIRQFTIHQTVMSGTTAGGITIQYMDREDQAIAVFIDDWRDKLGGRENRYMFRKEDTIATGLLTMYNSSRSPIREYTLYGMQPADGSPVIDASFTSDEPSNVGQYSIQFNFEHFELTWKNI